MVTIILLAIVVTIFATITLAGLSYGVFRMRERRNPRDPIPSEAGAPAFFDRVRFAAPETEAAH